MRKRRNNKRKSTSKGFIKKILILTGLAVLVFIAVGTLLSPQPKSDMAFCANSISCIKDLTGKFEPEQTKAVFLSKTMALPNQLAREQEIIQPVLGATNAPKKIYIDLTTQRLFALAGGKVIYDFPVSTGKWAKTPTGRFTTWIKLRYTRMEGGNPAIGTYYNLPNVPFTMFYYNASVPKSQGFSIHGAYWHNNFGHPMSHGCVNMKIEDAEKIYNWANPPSSNTITYATNDNPGTEVVVYGETPNE